MEPKLFYVRSFKDCYNVESILYLKSFYMLWYLKLISGQKILVKPKFFNLKSSTHFVTNKLWNWQELLKNCQIKITKHQLKIWFLIDKK